MVREKKIGMLAGRRATILKAAREYGCNTAIAATPQNVYYVTGFWGEGVAVIAEDRTRLFAVTLEAGRAEATSKDCEVVKVERGRGIVDAVARSVKARDRVCFDDVRASNYMLFSSRMRGRAVLKPDVFGRARRVKDEEEIKAMSEGGKLVDELYRYASELIKPSMTEREVQAGLLAEAVRLGGDLPGFLEVVNPFITASGPNSAYPHASLTNRAVRPGDFVVLDLVVRYHGYIVDATRTFAVRKASPEMKRVYEAVKQAQQEGVKNARPGATSGQVDRACRSRIVKKGFGRYFVHGTGHGVGLDVHEAPSITKGGREVLKRGDAITIEPGIYIPRRFGVRIEDSVVMAPRPGRLTNFPRDLMIVG